MIKHIPVYFGFDKTRPIGVLQIDVSCLPKEETLYDYVLAPGGRVVSKSLIGGKEIIEDCEVTEMGLVPDWNILEYLKQQEKLRND